MMTDLYSDMIVNASQTAEMGLHVREPNQVDVVIVIPAYNEAAAIGDTIRDYQSVFPESRIVVVDNNSKDQTSEMASALLRPSRDLLLFEPQKGKGFAIKRGLSRLQGDIYIMTDGDMTYPASELRRLYELMVKDRGDMIVGDRHSDGAYAKQNIRFGHTIGNRLLTKLISRLAGQSFNDVLSGARVMSAPFVAQLDVRSEGFQLETEINVVAAYLRAEVLEIAISYKARPEGSESKLSTFSDGWRIIVFAFLQWIAFLPLQFFSVVAVISWFFASLLGYRVLFGFIQTGWPYSTTAIAGASLAIIGTLALFTGLTLRIQGRAQRRQEIATFLQRKRAWNQGLDRYGL